MCPPHPHIFHVTSAPAYFSTGPPYHLTPTRISNGIALGDILRTIPFEIPPLYFFPRKPPAYFSLLPPCLFFFMDAPQLFYFSGDSPPHMFYYWFPLCPPQDLKWNCPEGPVTVCHDIGPDQHLYAISCIKNQRWSYKRAL